MGMSCFSKIFVGVLSFCRLGLSLAIIIIVADQLYRVDYWITGNDNVVFVTSQCLMEGSVNGQNVCNYAYAVSGLSLLLSLLTSILLCITCDMCGAGSWLEVIVEGFQTAWWIIAGSVISKKVSDTNDIVLEGGGSVPKKNYRNAVAVITWVSALLSLIIAIIYLAESLKAVAKCCGCCGYDKEDKQHKSHKKDKEDARKADYYAEQPQPGPGAPPAPAGQPTRGDEAVRADAV